MNNNFIPNFASTQEGLVRIEHFSTASVIKIIIQPNDSEDKLEEVWLDYRQFDDLIIAIQNLKP